MFLIQSCIKWSNLYLLHILLRLKNYVGDNTNVNDIDLRLLALLLRWITSWLISFFNYFIYPRSLAATLASIYWIITNVWCAEMRLIPASVSRSWWRSPGPQLSGETHLLWWLMITLSPEDELIRREIFGSNAPVFRIYSVNEHRLKGVPSENQGSSP